MAGKGGLPIDLLSPGGKIIAALMEGDGLRVKDIPDPAGISFRSCLDQIRKWEGLGIIERGVNPSSRSRLLVTLNQNYAPHSSRRTLKEASTA
jgi:hypothetical protein